MTLMNVKLTMGNVLRSVKTSLVITPALVLTALSTPDKMGLMSSVLTLVSSVVLLVFGRSLKSVAQCLHVHCLLV